MQSFSEFEPLAGFLLRDSLGLKPEDFSACKLSPAEQRKIMQQLLWRLEAQREDWEQDALFATIKALAEREQLKLRDLLATVFIAITGSSASFSVTEAMFLLGPDLTVSRLRQAIEVLDGLSARELKALRRETMADTENSRKSLSTPTPNQCSDIVNGWSGPRSAQPHYRRTHWGTADHELGTAA